MVATPSNTSLSVAVVAVVEMISMAAQAAAAAGLVDTAQTDQEIPAAVALRLKPHLVLVLAPIIVSP